MCIISPKFYFPYQQFLSAMCPIRHCLDLAFISKQLSPIDFQLEYKYLTQYSSLKGFRGRKQLH
jgi:hypothetical protein